MKKIVLPTDFSQNAKNAISYALQLFAETDCTLYLFHTYAVPIYYSSEYQTINPYLTDLMEQYHNESMAQLERLKAELETTYPNPRHSYVVKALYGDPIEELREFVEDEQVDLVVMGTKGATGARELLFGSNTVRAIKKVKCPLIAVPEQFRYEVPKEILFPTDYEVPFNTILLQELLSLSKIHLGCINVLHIATGYELNEVQKGNLEELRGILKPFAHLFHETEINDVIEGINEFQLKQKMNLLVMVMHKHTFLESLFIKPMIRKIGLHIHIPFMVLPYVNRK